MKLVFDIEANNLLLYVSKVWCIVCKDVETKDIYTFKPNQIKEALRFLSEAEELIGHNICGYDLLALMKLYGFNFNGKVTDTLVLSRLLNPDRRGGHSLEVWGARLGYPKIDFHEFSYFSEEMLTYCIGDVELNYRVYLELLKEM